MKIENESNKSQQQTLLTVREVATLLRLSEASIYLMATSGKLPHLRVGNGRGSIRFRTQEIESILLEGQRSQPIPRPTRERHAMKHLKVRGRAS